MVTVAGSVANPPPAAGSPGSEVGSHGTLVQVERHLLTGCYELLHFGHLNALRQVKQCYDRFAPSMLAADMLDGQERQPAEPHPKVHVVAGIHSNEEILRVKGGVCILSEAEKARMLLSCKFVDEVAHNVPYDTIRPDKYDCRWAWHGDDEVKVGSTDLFGWVKEQGMFKTLRRTEGISTTLMISRFFAQISTDSGVEVPAQDTPKGAAFSLGATGSETAVPEEKSACRDVDVLGGAPSLVQAILSKQDRQGAQYINATASRISRFFLPSRPRAHKCVVYLEGTFDLFHVGYVDILEEMVATEMRRKNLQKVGDVFVILGIRSPSSVGHTSTALSPVVSASAAAVQAVACPEALQSLHERAISILSLKIVDDVVFDVQNRVDETFRRALGINSVYGVTNHCDFPDPVPADAVPADGAGQRQNDVAMVNNSRSSDVPLPARSSPCDRFDVIVDGSKHFSSATIVQRVLESRKILEKRQREKKEPVLSEAEHADLLDG